MGQTIGHRLAVRAEYGEHRPAQETLLDEPVRRLWRVGERNPSVETGIERVSAPVNLCGDVLSRSVPCTSHLRLHSPLEGPARGRLSLMMAVWFRLW